MLLANEIFVETKQRRELIATEIFVWAIEYMKERSSLNCADQLFE